MGQRSQIYIRIKEKHTNSNYLIASYFQWNWGFHMIARARHLIEYIKENIDYIYWKEYRLKLRRYAEINFSNQNIVLSTNINEEFVVYGNDSDYTDYIFFSQDNNDGKLFIDIDADTKNIKYCFTDCEGENPLSVKQYMEFDEGINWHTNYDIEDINIIKDNSDYIQKNAKLMNSEELNEMINADYVDKPKKHNDVYIKEVIENIIPVSSFGKFPYAKIKVTDDKETKIVTIKQDKNNHQYFCFNKKKYFVKNISDNHDFPLFEIVS